VQLTEFHLRRLTCRVCYTPRRRAAVKAGVAVMRRSALFVVFQWLGTMAFCQSTAIPLQVAPATPQPQVIGSSKIGQLSPAFRNAHSCADPNAVQSRTNAPAEVIPLPCMNTNPVLQTAQISLPPPPLPAGRLPRSEPIPTQWPNARFERIPTTWPNLRMLPIEGDNPRPVSKK